MSHFNYIDLFAGCGGLSEGFIRAGFNPVAHVEMDKAACNTLKTRTCYHFLKSVGRFNLYESYLKGEISRDKLYASVPTLLLDTIVNMPIGLESNPFIFKIIDKATQSEEIDLIIGGPPCQAYSLVGRARSSTNMEGDPRNYLYIQYALYLERYNPKMFVFENVLGLKSAKKGSYLRDMESLFLSKGYLMKVFTVEANNFGVLQNRKRIIIIGWRKSIQRSIPNLGSIRINHPECKVNNLLEDLPAIQAGEGVDKYIGYVGSTNLYLDKAFIRNGINVLTQHIARPHTLQDKEIYRIAVEKWNNQRERLIYNDLPSHLKTHQNRSSFLDRFKVVAANESFSQTVVAHIAKDGHYYIHPDIRQNRSISIREAARIQSFPDDYYFEGVANGRNRTVAFKQIGNAVPPMMAYEIAKLLKEALCQK